MGEHIRLVIGARVSTRDQADHGTSLETQLEACRRYAERIGAAVVAEIAEDVSGVVHVKDRPQQSRIVRMLASGEADGVLWYCADRFSRDELDARVQIREWLRAGRQFHTCDLGHVTDHGDYRLLFGLKMADDERIKIRERTMRGTWRKAQSGKWVGNGRPPYGYRAEGIGPAVRLVIDKDRAAVVRRIYRYYLAGMTAHGIARKLTELGIASPRPGKRGAWQTSTVDGILRAELYTGAFYFGKRTTAGGVGGKRPKDEQAMIQIPPIIERDTWQAAQAQRASNKRHSPRNVRREYLLRGLIRCGCGASMSGACTNGDIRYYQCSRKAQRHRGLEAVCVQKWVRADAVEALVMAELDSIISDADAFERALVEVRDAHTDEMQPRRDDLAEVERAIERCERDTRDYIEQRRAAHGALERKTLDDMIAERERQYAELIGTRNALEAELAQGMLTNAEIDALLELREDIAAGMESSDFATRRGVLLDMSAAVVVHGAKVGITFAVGQGVTRELKTMPRREKSREIAGDFDSFTRR